MFAKISGTVFLDIPSNSYIKNEKHMIMST